jgi:three-Cys-motif partner protein
MAAPKTVIWDLEPHTRAKHAILRRYLDAWLPILSQGRFPKILYIDGFAGPGVYSQGEDGSPIIALKAALAGRIPPETQLRFFFVEKERARAESLQQLVEALKLPRNYRVKLEPGITFEEGFGRLLQLLDGKLPPTFAFIDPFGWAVPFEIVKTILAAPNCEVLVNFMYEEINRFLAHPVEEQQANFDRFFGTPDWRECNAIKEPRARARFLHDLYMRQLKNVAGARYVRSFQMRNDRDVIDYYLFYATNSLRGLSKMKDAMWKVDESGEFRFSDATDPSQLVMFEKEPPTERVRAVVAEHFAGKNVTVAQVKEWVVGETAFREAHVKGALKALEMGDPPGLQVFGAPPSRRRGTYADEELVLDLMVLPTRSR